MSRAWVAVCLAAAVFASLLGGSGCAVATAPEPPEPRVEVTLGERVFTVFAGMVAVGYGADSDPSGENPLRRQVLQATADWSAEAVSGFDWLVCELAQNGPDNVTWVAMDMSGPPLFYGYYCSNHIPRTAEAVKNLWTDIEPIYASALKSEGAAAGALVPQAQDAIRRALGRAGMRASPYNLWKVILNPLAEPGFSSNYAETDTGTASIVIGPPAESQVEAIAREAFRLLLSDNDFGELETFGGLSRFMKAYDWAGQFRPWRGPSLATYVKENLAAALASRLPRPATLGPVWMRRGPKDWSLSRPSTKPCPRTTADPAWTSGPCSRRPTLRVPSRSAPGPEIGRSAFARRPRTCSSVVGGGKAIAYRAWFTRATTGGPRPLRPGPGSWLPFPGTSPAVALEALCKSRPSTAES